MHKMAATSLAFITSILRNSATYLSGAVLMSLIFQVSYSFKSLIFHTHTLALRQHRYDEGPDIPVANVQLTIAHLLFVSVDQHSFTGVSFWLQICDLDIFGFGGFSLSPGK